MGPRGLVTLCFMCHALYLILHNHDQLFIGFSSSKYAGTHTKRTCLLHQSLYGSHFIGPISSVKLQTNFLGIPLKMIHPHFQLIFPISYWGPLAFLCRRPSFPVHTVLLIFPFCLLCFLLGLSDGDQIVWNLLVNHLFFSHPPQKATPHNTFLDNVPLSSRPMWLHWF